MGNLGMLVIQAPLAAFALMVAGGGYFFEKSVDSDRLRDFLAYMAYMLVGSFIVVMIGAFTFYVFGGFLG